MVHRIMSIIIMIGIMMAFNANGISMIYANKTEENEILEDGILLVSLPGEALRACVVTYPQFLDKIGGAAGHENPAIQYLSSPENYNIKVYDQGNSYMVRYTIKLSQYPGLKGGSMDFVIDTAIPKAF